jgi:hypothetical protein
MDRLPLPAGTPVLIAGYAEMPYNEYGFRHTIKVAYAGRLLEPCHPGFSVRLADGPLAGNVSVKAIVEHREYRCGRPADLIRTSQFIDGATHFLVFEDREGLAAEVGSGPLSWPKPMVLAQRIAICASDRMYEHIDLAMRA